MVNNAFYLTDCAVFKCMVIQWTTKLRQIQFSQVLAGAKTVNMVNVNDPDLFSLFKYLERNFVAPQVWLLLKNYH
jgi:hypothetical protein